MSDIVEQLRKHHRDVGLSDDVESWLTAAADEIERLREALQDMMDTTPYWLADVRLAENYSDARAKARAALGEKE